MIHVIGMQDIFFPVNICIASVLYCICVFIYLQAVCVRVSVWKWDTLLFCSQNMKSVKIAPLEDFSCDKYSRESVQFSLSSYLTKEFSTDEFILG